MTQRLTNPDGSYFDVPDDDKIVKQKPRGATDDDPKRGWYRDPNGWWKNADPERAWNPKPPGAPDH